MIEDFTEATELETFISSIEKTIKKWKLDNGTVDKEHLLQLFHQGADHCREKFVLNGIKIELKLSFILENDGGGCSFLPAENAFKEPTMLHRQTGLPVVLVVTPERIVDGDITVRSALHIALLNTNCHVCYILNNAEHGVFSGLCMSDTYDTMIRVSRLKYTPSNLSNLSAICDIIKENHEFDALQAKLSICWKYEIENVLANDATLRIIAESSDLALSSVVENEMFSNIELSTFVRVVISLEFDKSSELKPYASILQRLANARKQDMHTIASNSVVSEIALKAQNIIDSIFVEDAHIVTYRGIPYPAHVAPPGSLLYSLLSHFIHDVLYDSNNEISLLMLTSLWACFIGKIRWHWEHKAPLPDLIISTEQDDISTASLLQWNLLHQKLVVLNVCIQHINNSNDDTDTFFDAVPEQTRSLSDNPSSSNLLNGEIMIIPPLFEPEILTQDEILEQQTLFENLGDTESGVQVRRNMQTAQLFSDMQAFKAVNPRCILEDFVRWYSPRDYSTVNGLSSRMMAEGNIWQTLWQSAEPLPISEQKPLFDPILKGEKIIHWMELLDPESISKLLFPIACFVICHELADQKAAIDLIVRHLSVIFNEEMAQAIETVDKIETEVENDRETGNLFAEIDLETLQKLKIGEWVSIQEESILKLSNRLPNRPEPVSKEYLIEHGPSKIYCLMKSDELLLSESYSMTS